MKYATTDSMKTAPRRTWTPTTDENGPVSDARLERRKPRKAVRAAHIARSPRGEGVVSPMTLSAHDNGLWVVNGEVCDTQIDAVEAILAVMRAMQRRARAGS